MIAPDMRALLEAGVHFGHQTHRWNPKMKPFIFMKRNGIHIIDLAKTVACMQTAQAAVHDVVSRGERILFVCTKTQGKSIVREEGLRCGMPCVTDRWLGGTLTNLRTIRRSVRRLEDIERMSQDGTYEYIPKKEALRYEREREKLNKVLAGFREMDRLPGLLYVVDTRKERIAVNEANKLGIPIVGVLDTNADPEKIAYPIPGNDDAIRAIKLITGFIADAVLDAKATVLEGKDAAAVEAVQGASGAEAVAQ